MKRYLLLACAISLLNCGSDRFRPPTEHEIELENKARAERNRSKQPGYQGKSEHDTHERDPNAAPSEPKVNALLLRTCETKVGLRFKETFKDHQMMVADANGRNLAAFPGNGREMCQNVDVEQGQNKLYIKAKNPKSDLYSETVILTVERLSPEECGQLEAEREEKAKQDINLPSKKPRIAERMDPSNIDVMKIRVYNDTEGNGINHEALAQKIFDTETSSSLDPDRTTSAKFTASKQVPGMDGWVYPLFDNAVAIYIPFKEPIDLAMIKLAWFQIDNHQGADYTIRYSTENEMPPVFTDSGDKSDIHQETAGRWRTFSEFKNSTPRITTRSDTLLPGGLEKSIPGVKHILIILREDTNTWPWESFEIADIGFYKAIKKKQRPAGNTFTLSNGLCK